MSLVDFSVYSKRYGEALAPGVIKARAETYGSCVGDLSLMREEEACKRLDVAADRKLTA